MAEYRKLGEYKPSNLIAGEYPIITQSIILAAGQNLPKGAVLGRTQKGDYMLSQAGATDGSEFPIAVLAEDVDASKSEVTSVCYFSGQFNVSVLHFGAGHTPESTAHNLRLMNIYLTYIA